jgi:hypothetical protein
MTSFAWFNARRMAAQGFKPFRSEAEGHIHNDVEQGPLRKSSPARK